MYSLSLLPLASTISRTRGVLSHLDFFDTQAPSVSTEELLPRHARCTLCLLLNSYLTRIGGIENPSCSACGHPIQDISSHSSLSSYGLFAPLTLCRSTISGPGPGESPDFWGSVVFRHTPIARKGSSSNNNYNGLARHFMATLITWLYVPISRQLHCCIFLEECLNAILRIWLYMQACSKSALCQ